MGIANNMAVNLQRKSGAAIEDLIRQVTAPVDVLSNTHFLLDKTMPQDEYTRHLLDVQGKALEQLVAAIRSTH